PVAGRQRLDELQHVGALGGPPGRAVDFHDVVHRDPVLPRIVQNGELLLSEVLAPRRHPEIGNRSHGHSSKRFPRVFLASYALGYSLLTLVKYTRKKRSFLSFGLSSGGRMPRMQILTAAEHQAFETPPVFSPTEREMFFHLSESLQKLLATLRSPTNGVGLVLTVGYFRATKRFFAVPCHQADVAYVAHQLGYTPDQIDLAAYDAKATASRHRRLTLDYLGFRPF